MSSVERERVLGKKRDGPGSLSGRRVFEAKKEKKKRRLILSDSESDDDKFVVSPRDKVLVADSVDSIKVELKSDLGSEVVKQSEEADSNKKNLVGSKAHHDGVDSLVKERSDIDGPFSNEAVKVEEKRVSGSEVGDERGKGSMHESMGTEDIKVEANRCLSLEGVEKREEDDINNIEDAFPIKKKSSIDQLAIKERIKVESEMASRSGSDKKNEAHARIKTGADVSGASHNGRGSTPKKKNNLAQLGSKHEMVIDAKKALKSKVAKEREEVESKKKFSSLSRYDHNENSSMTKKKASLDQLSSQEKMKVEAKKVLKSQVVKEGEEAGSNKKSSAFSGVDQKEGDSSSRKKNNSDQLTSKVDKKVEPNKFLNSKVVKEREGAEKKAAEPCSERKRSRETPNDEISLKKFRSEPVRHRQEHGMEAGERSMKRKFLKSGDKGCDIEANLGSKSLASVNRQRDESDEKRMQEDLKQKSEVETENGRWIERSSARTLRKLKDNRTSSGGPSRADVDISQQKGIRVQGKGGVLRVLPSNKKVAGIERVHIQREEKEKRKSMASYPPLFTKRRIEKSISTCKSVTDQLNPGKVSSAENAKPCRGKTEMEVSSLNVKSKKVDSSNAPVDPMSKAETWSKSKASAMTELSTKEEPGERRGIVKQKVRDQIKGILLDAGWKIELKPRRGRAYEDAVYVPPSGGSGFWSITKAYAVYEAHCHTLSENSCEKSTGGDQGYKGTPTFATIPAHLLKLLTRNVVNKRGSGKKSEESKKLGARKKGKGSLKIKGSKNYGGRIHGNDDNEGGKVRKKRNTHVDDVGSGVHKPHLRVRNKEQRGCALLVRGVNQDADTDDDDDGYVPYIWKRTILSWMIDLGVLRVDGKVKYMNKKQTRALLEGCITRDGIRCGCCSKIISISKFEIHAGSKLQQPYQNIFVEDMGISLLQCQLNAWEKQQESERQSFYRVDIEGDDPNDDTCGICGDGGDLVCCDGCPSTFHLNCLGIQMLPPGDWHCTNCSCRYCGLVSDSYPKESGSATSTLPTCSQCDKKYHHECVPEADAISVCSNDSSTSFCGKSCKMVFKRLQKFLGTKNDLEAGLSWSLIRHFGEDSSGKPCSLSQKVECNSKIAVAFAVMDECFRPIVDHRSGINLIHNVVYNCGSNINRLSYSGFYTFVLERGDEIIAVASVRIHGTRLAEMPFIGTRNMYRRQGMCRQLLRGIESALRSLNVEKLIIPAISELTETWTGIFGFKPLDLSQRQEVRSINMLVFPGTGLLHKPVLKKGRIEERTTAGGGELGEPVTENEQTSEALKKYSMLSTCQPTTCGSAEDVVHLKHESEGAELVLQTTESFDASSRSEFQALQCNSSDTACDVDLSVRPKVDQNELTAEDTLQINSYNVLKIELPCKVTVHGNQGADNAASALASVDYAVDATSTGRDTVIKHRHLLGAADESSVSCIRTDLPGADQLVTHPKSETEAVCHNKPMGEDTFQKSSLNEPNNEASCDFIMLDNHKVKYDEVTVTSNLHAVVASSIGHATEDGCTTQEAPGAKITCNFLENRNTLLQQNCVVHCNSSGINSSTLQDCDGCSLHLPVGSRDFSSDATHLHGSESTSKSSSSSVVEHGFLAEHEHIVDRNLDGGNKFTIRKTKLRPFDDTSSHYNSDTIAECEDSTKRKNPGSFVESNIYEVGEGAATDVCDVEAELDHVTYDPNSAEEDTKPCTSRVNDKPSDIPQAKENGQIGSSVTKYSCTGTKPDNGFSYRSSTQENSELLHKQPGCSVVSRSSTDKLNHCYNDLPSSLNLCPAPDLNISNSGVPLEKFHDTNVNDGCTQEKPYSFGENCVQRHMSEMADEALVIICESNISSSCEVKSCEMPPDGYNHRQHMGAKDSAPVVLGDSVSCEFTDGTLLGASTVKSESGTVRHVHDSIPKSPNIHLDEDAGAGAGAAAGVSICISITSGEPLNELMVQHDLEEVNKVAADVCIKPGTFCAEGVHDTTLSEDGLTGVFPAHTVVSGSPCCASKQS